ncbi:MAG TPA: hypothetical protein VGD37_05910 [Kofleriaceae bacterium]
MKQLLWIVVVLIATTGGVRAESADATSATKITLARRLYDEGVDAFGKGQWSLAYDRFKTSYELAPRVLTLYNLAGAQGQTGRLVEATENYRKFLRDTGDGRYPDLRAEATNQMELLGKQIAQLTLDIPNLEPSDAIAIDDVEFPHAALHEALAINPGSHVARIQRGTVLLATRTVTLASGAAEVVHMELPVKSPDLTVHQSPAPPIGTAIAAAPGATAALHRPVDHGTSRAWLRSPWLWSGVAAVVVASAGGAYLLTRPDGVVIK